ncbi:hypothetical protein TSUD_88240 [Trifolium subterraneum]|uniref:Uncharacterized protein n=1 Tax=Trifolium subterraneum TaxID=3900 RepID=A0A2Z6N748_TRISU|nr:hypothetical protein TSUD_88240 [Trifolium subterraneum]
MSSITGLCTDSEVVSSFVTSVDPVKAYVPGVTALSASINHDAKMESVVSGEKHVAFLNYWLSTDVFRS